MSCRLLRTVRLTPLSETHNTEESDSSTLQFHQLDISNLHSIERFGSFIAKKHGGFDVLVQNASIGITLPKGIDQYADKVEKLMNTNFWGALNVLKTLSPMIRPNGRIVMLSSMSSFGALDRVFNVEKTFFL